MTIFPVFSDPFSPVYNHLSAFCFAPLIRHSSRGTKIGQIDRRGGSAYCAATALSNLVGFAFVSLCGFYGMALQKQSQKFFYY